MNSLHTNNEIPIKPLCAINLKFLSLSIPVKEIQYVFSHYISLRSHDGMSKAVLDSHFPQISRQFTPRTSYLNDFDARSRSVVLRKNRTFFDEKRKRQPSIVT